MDKREYPRVDETLYSQVLPNGLTVKVVPKPGFQRKVAYFVTDFGAIHRDFLLEGQECHVPAGIAHFLEHKLFELPGRDVSAEFAALGGNVNAFTSHDMTAYYFSCTANFEENLALLLEFVSTPYFPADSVQREMGIIDQEIAMCLDEPETREYEVLTERMYRHHRIRTPILGTPETIRQITPALLELTHRAFYTPANMILCVVGDVDAEAVVQLAEQVLGGEYRPPAVKLPSAPEDMTDLRAGPPLRMDVAYPTFLLGFKSEPAPLGPGSLRETVVGHLAAEMLFGESTALYHQLYDSESIGSSFGGGFETLDGCALLTCGGDSDRPEQVRQAILARARELAAQGLEEEEFLRLKRGDYGTILRNLDSFDNLCFRICAYHFTKFDYLTFPEVYETITAQEVQAFIDRVIRPERCCTVITHPID